MSPSSQQPFSLNPALGVGSAQHGGEASASGEGAALDYGRAEAVAMGSVVDVTPMARLIGFTFPVYLTRGAHAEGVSVTTGLPAGEGLHTLLTRAYEAYRLDRRGKEKTELHFVTPWRGSNQGVVQLKLRLARHERRTRYATVLLAKED